MHFNTYKKGNAEIVGDCFVTMAPSDLPFMLDPRDKIIPVLHTISAQAKATTLHSTTKIY